MPVKQSDMMRVPVPPGKRAHMEQVRAQLEARTGRTVNLAEVQEKLLDAWDRADETRRELEEINTMLRAAGISYPLGARGVAEVIRQRDTYLTELESRG